MYDKRSETQIIPPEASGLLAGVGSLPNADAAVLQNIYLDTIVTRSKYMLVDPCVNRQGFPDNSYRPSMWRNPAGVRAVLPISSPTIQEGLGPVHRSVHVQQTKYRLYRATYGLDLAHRQMGRGQSWGIVRWVLLC